jgi:superfamily I DNA/RNA helicase
LSLNKEQSLVVESESHCLVLACPGAGKTKTIVAKIGAIFLRHKNAKICAVTFTRDSAKEMRERVSAEHGSELMKSCFIGTFHSTIIKWMVRNNKLGKCISPAEQRAYVDRARIQCELFDLPYETAQEILDRLKSAITPKPANDLEAALFNAYSGLLSRNKVVDLNDVITSCVRMMQRKEIPPLPITHLLVDEFQDTDEVQLMFILEHAKAGAIITAVGDDDQSIYGWRRALGYAGMTSFQEKTGAQMMVLGTNYRCRAEILAASDRLICHNQNRVYKRLHAFKGEGGEVDMISVASRMEEADKIVTDILNYAIQLKDNKKFILTVPKGKYAILARTNRIMRIVEAALSASRIEHFTSSKPIWTEVPVIHMLAILKSLRSGEKAPFDQMFHWAGMLPEDLDYLHRALGDDFSDLYLEKGNIDLKQLSGDSRKILKSFMEVAPDWKKQEEEKRYNLVIEAVANWMHKFIKDKDETELLIIATRVLSKMKDSLASRIAILTMFSGDDNSEGVAMHTMHGCKGLEFDNVWILAAEETVLPSPKAVEGIDEERRLMFVAMTRAKERLKISYHLTNGPSRFLHEAGLTSIKLIKKKH